MSFAAEFMKFPGKEQGTKPANNRRIPLIDHPYISILPAFCRKFRGTPGGDLSS
jgi:hypothetical protein